MKDHKLEDVANEQNMKVFFFFKWNSAFPRNANMRVYIFFMSALLPGTFVFQAACVPPLNSWTHHHSIFLLVVTEVAWGQLFPQQLTKSLDEEESDIVTWTTRPPASSPCPPGWEAGRLSLLGAQRGSGGGVWARGGGQRWRYAK